MKTSNVKVDSSDVKIEKNEGGPGGFTKMNTEEIKIEKLDISPSQTYVSPEVKKKQAFKYFNNTYTYITFRQSQMKTDGGEKINLRFFWNNDIIPWLHVTKTN